MTNTLLKRKKRIETSTPINVDTMVVIKMNYLSLIWNIERITEIYPGIDGITRIISVKAANSVLGDLSFRYVHFLCHKIGKAYLLCARRVSFRKKNYLGRWGKCVKEVIV